MNVGPAVLIIDDDPDAVEVVQEVLASAGFATAAAQNPFHGLRLAREVKPAVVVCDFLMPNMAGADVFRALASDPATAKIPRVMMSGRPDADCSCADAFLQKPFEAEHMIGLLKQLTTQSSAPEPMTAMAEPAWHG